MDAKTLDTKLISDEIIWLELSMQINSGHIASHMLEIRKIQELIKGQEEDKERLEKKLNELSKE